MLEKEIERRVCAYAKKLGWRPRKYQTPAHRGAPDRVYFKRPGRIFFIEFKAAGKKPTKLQEQEIKRLRDEGFWVFVVDNVEDGKAIVEMMS